MYKCQPAMCLVAFVSLCAIHVSVRAAEHLQERAFVGWLGDTYYDSFAATPAQDASTQVEVISWEPRVFLHRGFLSTEESEHIRTKAQPRLTPSATTDPDTAQPKLEQTRTSSGMFFNRREDEVIERIEQRIAAWTMLPAGNAEGLQVLQYEVGQKYDPHHDYFYHPSHILNGGNRVATVILYLADVDEGGETVFPDVPKLPHQTAANGWTECGMMGLGVRPRKGDALLFWSIRPDGVFDELTRHASCPVVKGQKVVATRWIHEKDYEVTPDGEGPWQQQQQQQAVDLDRLRVVASKVLGSAKSAAVVQATSS